jgi:hypothetical protein
MKEDLIDHFNAHIKRRIFFAGGPIAMTTASHKIKGS